MKCWKLPNEQYLIEGEPISFPTSGVRSIQLPQGQILYKSASYYAVTREGQVTATYGPARAFSLEDVLCVYDLYAVTNGQFCRYYWQQQWGREEEVSVSQTLYTELAECGMDDLPFDPTVIASGGT